MCVPYVKISLENNMAKLLNLFYTLWLLFISMLVLPYSLSYFFLFTAMIRLNLSCGDVGMVLCAVWTKKKRKLR